MSLSGRRVAKVSESFEVHQHDQSKWEARERQSRRFHDKVKKWDEAKLAGLTAKKSPGATLTWAEQKKINEKTVFSSSSKRQKKKPAAQEEDAIEDDLSPAKSLVKTPRRRRSREEEDSKTPPPRRSRRKKEEEGRSADAPVVIGSDDDVEDFVPATKKTPGRRSSSSRKRDEEENRVILQYPFGASAVDAVALTAGDLSRLEETEFLNDNIVDFFLKLETTDRDLSQLLSIDESLSPSVVRNQVHVFSSHFYTKLHETRISQRKRADHTRAYERVERWTRDRDVFAYKFLLVPIVERLHWSLAVVCNPAKLLVDNVTDLIEEDEDDEVPCIVFMDSLKMHAASTVHFNLRTWLCLEADSKKKSVPEAYRKNNSLTKDALPLVAPKVPLQSNGWDCGVFLLRYAREFLSLVLERPGHAPLRVNKRRVATKFEEDDFSAWFKNTDIVKLRLHIKQQIHLLQEKHQALLVSPHDKGEEEEEERKEEASAANEAAAAAEESHPTPTTSPTAPTEEEEP